jgi:hypothetical protein
MDLLADLNNPSLLRIQRQTAAVRMFLSFFGLSILAFAISEHYVQRLPQEAKQSFRNK